MPACTPFTHRTRTRARARAFPPHQHVRSGKFITVAPDDVAEVESACSLVSLTDGTSFSWLTIKPRYKVHTDGDVVEAADQVVFEFKHVEEQFLHCTPPTVTVEEDDLAKGEVNCSQAMPPTAWYVQLFGSYMPDENQFVRTLSMVKLHHPQSGSFLTANVAMVNDDGDPVSSNLTMLQAVSQGDATASGSANSNFIWVLERQNNRVGGIAQWSMDFKLRHYNTGLFLCAGHKSTPVCKDFLGNDQGEDGFVSDACIATELLAGAKSAESSRQAAGLFKLQPLSTKRSQANDDRIPRNAGFRLKLVESKNGDLWLRKGDELFQEEEDIMLNGIECVSLNPARRAPPPQGVATACGCLWVAAPTRPVSLPLRPGAVRRLCPQPLPCALAADAHADRRLSRPTGSWRACRPTTTPSRWRRSTAPSTPTRSAR